MLGVPYAPFPSMLEQARLFPRVAEPARHISLSWRVACVLALVTINTVIYLGINAYPIRAPQLLPLTAVDAWLGRHAWTIWPYWLLLLINPLLAVAIRERRLLLATLRAYLLAIGCNVVVWLAWPTRIARDGVPEALDPLTDGAWQVLFALDGDNNCFPSGHITIPVVVAAGFCAQYPQARRWVWPLVIVLAPSIVTTGQHYAWDLFGGALTAVIGLWLAGGDLRRPRVGA